MTPEKDKNKDKEKDKFSATTATSIVIANMIGTGVFTSLGFQLLDIQSAPVIIFLWGLGGLLALCGALCYAELGTALPRSGGEYNYLARVYHPGVGFIAGWISATVGFAAPTALAAMTAGAYFHAVFIEVSQTWVAVGLVVLTTIVHLRSRRQSARFQMVFTSLKVALIVVFIVAAWVLVDEVQDVRWMPVFSDLDLITTGSVAVALIFVNYAYTGWNAATYLAGEMQDPSKNLPRVLLLGTLFVTFLYVTLHLLFLSVAPMSAMAGQIEIGYIVADYAFGEVGRQLIAGTLGILLVSTISAMLLAGPRALQVIGQDYRSLRLLRTENKHGIPQAAIGVQATITLVLVVTATFESVLLFASFVLALNTLLTVVGVWRLRKSEPTLPRPFKVPLYPLPLVIFLTITLWTLVYVAVQEPIEVGFALGLIVLGWLFYLLSRARVAD